MAIRAIKTLLLYSGSSLDRLYKGLIRDVFGGTRIDAAFSDGYDVAQTAICFLCGYIGQRLRNSVMSRGKEVTVKHACYTEVNRFVSSLRNSIYYDVSYEDAIKEYEPFAEFEGEDTEQPHIDDVIDRMELTDVLRDTLNCYLAGMGYVEIAKFLNVNNTTIWRRRKQLQTVYTAKFGAV